MGIKNLKTGKGEITSQNHGFVISKDGISDNSKINFRPFLHKEIKIEIPIQNVVYNFRFKQLN